MPDDVSRRTDRPLVAVTVVLVTVYIVINVVLALLRPDYSVIGDVESDYGRGRFSWLMDIDFVIRGVLSITALIVLARRRIARPWTGILVGIWAVTSALLAFFPTNIVGRPRIPSGPVHTGLATVGFIAIAIATVAMSVRIQRRSAGPRVAATGLLVVSGLGALFLLGLRPATALHGAGLDERLFLLSQLVWLAWASMSTTTIVADREPASVTTAG